MKILTFDKPSADAKPVTVNFYLDEDVRGQVSQQVTVAHFNPINPSFVRHVQVSGNYIIITRPSFPSAGFHIDDLVQMLVNQIPEMSFAPLFFEMPQGGVIGENGFKLSVKICSELPATVTWQVLVGGEWKGCGTGETLTVEDAAKYRAVATNAKGSTISAEATVAAKPIAESK
jgi:hypothetical protein